MTQYELPTNVGHRIGSKMYNWFIAPETTSYRFHMSCDDYCDLNMGLDVADPLKTELIVSRRNWSSRRSYFKHTGGD